MRLFRTQLDRFEEAVCTAFADAAEGLELARKTSKERTEIARAFLYGYTRGGLSDRVEEIWQAPEAVVRVTRGMVEYAMYAHLLGGQASCLMGPREFIRA